ncbi:response regulator [Agromyces sp. NPDC055520]
MSGIRVAVVDDHELFRQGVRALLAAGGEFELVAVGGSPGDALRIGVVETPDVLLLDIRMPGGSGLDVIARLRKASPATAIVMLTMVDEDEAVAEALALGAYGYVLKGAQPDELERVIRAAARGDLLLGASVAPKARALLRHSDGAWSPPLPGLTERERQVLDLSASGLSPAMVATRLHLSVKTVRNVLTSATRRMGVQTRAEAEELARRAGLGRG